MFTIQTPVDVGNLCWTTWSDQLFMFHAALQMFQPSVRWNSQFLEYSRVAKLGAPDIKPSPNTFGAWVLDIDSSGFSPTPTTSVSVSVSFPKVLYWMPGISRGVARRTTYLWSHGFVGIWWTYSRKAMRDPWIYGPVFEATWMKWLVDFLMVHLGKY